MSDQAEPILNPPVPVAASGTNTANRAGTSGPVSGEPATIKFIQDVVIGIVIVLFLGFAAIFVSVALAAWQAWTQKATSNQELVNKIEAQNVKIDFLLQQMSNEKTAPQAIIYVPVGPGQVQSATQ